MVIGYHNSNEELVISQTVHDAVHCKNNFSESLDGNKKQSALICVTSSKKTVQVIYMPLEMTWYGYTLYSTVQCVET